MKTNNDGLNGMIIINQEYEKNGKQLRTLHIVFNEIEDNQFKLIFSGWDNTMSNNEISPYMLFSHTFTEYNSIVVFLDDYFKEGDWLYNDGQSLEKKIFKREYSLGLDGDLNGKVEYKFDIPRDYRYSVYGKCINSHEDLFDSILGKTLDIKQFSV